MLEILSNVASQRLGILVSELEGIQNVEANPWGQGCLCSGEWIILDLKLPKPLKSEENIELEI